MPDQWSRSSIRRWMDGGLLAVVFFCVALVSFYFSFAHVLLDLAGTRVEGRVAEIRAGSLWLRPRMTVPVFMVRYSFDTVEGETVTGVHSVAKSTLDTLGLGGAVSVDYLSLLPALNRVERSERDFLFFVFAALTLVCLWLAGRSIYRGFVRPLA